MKYGIYAMKDAKTTFMPVQVDLNDDSARRNFAYAVNQPDSMLSAYPNDYALFKLGEFDNESGEITPCCVQICDAAQILQKG